MDISKSIPKLEEYDFLRVSQLLSDYEQKAANRVSIRIPMAASLFGSFVTVMVDMNARGRLKSSQPSPVLLEAWIAWMSTNLDECRARFPISITESRAYADDKVLNSIKVAFSDESTTFCLADEADCITAQNADRLIIEFVSPSIYFLLPEKQPFTRSMLNLQLNIASDSSYTILYLDYPIDMSLRSRKDNSDYHSLAYATDNNLIRKITFIPNQPIHLRLTWGTNDLNKLMAPSMPLYAFGISLLTASFTLLLQDAGLQELAATVFALSLLPPYFQLISGKRLMFPSADIKRFSYDDWTLVLSFAIYLPLLVTTAVGLVWSAIDKRIMTILDGGVGLAFIVILLLYMFLLGQSVFQHYACDDCEKPILFRRTAKLDMDTRRTLCSESWRKLSALRAVEKTEERSGRRDNG